MKKESPADTDPVPSTRPGSHTDTGPSPSALPADAPLPQGDAGHHRHWSYVPRSLKTRRLPMRYGWYWLIEGFALWGRSPAFLCFLAFSGLFAWILAQLIPGDAGFVGFILYPGLILGVFNGCRAIDRKRNLNPALLISGFRRHAFDLLLAGFCNFIVTMAWLASTWLIDDGKLWRIDMHSEGSDSAASALDPALLSPIYLPHLLLLILWIVTYLFVPQLIGWWRLSVPKALLFSLKGCLINFLPFLVYFICFGFFYIMLSALVINFFGLIDEGLVVVVCAVFLVIASPALVASFYVAARDIYGFPRRRKHRRRHAPPEQDGRKPHKAQA
jgi:hypothetical protein